MDKVAIWAYNNGSESANFLAEKLDVNIIRKTNSRFRWRPRWTVINWGTTNCRTNRDGFIGKVVNHPDAVNYARDKTKAFSILLDQDVSIPEFTTSLSIASEWLREGDVCRRLSTTGHEGYGLEIFSPGQETAFRSRFAPLYTKYVKKKAEYRVHVAFGEAIHIQKKLRKAGAEGDSRVRNTANGFVFTSRDLQPPADLVPQAKAAVAALGLDFGAVDLIYNQRYDKVYVLEVNTAPGIEGVSLDKYVEAFKKELE